MYYDSMEGIGRVKSGIKTENNTGAITEEYLSVKCCGIRACAKTRDHTNFSRSLSENRRRQVYAPAKPAPQPSMAVVARESCFESDFSIDSDNFSVC